jgi:hypothetical protein
LRVARDEQDKLAGQAGDVLIVQRFLRQGGIGGLIGFGYVEPALQPAGVPACRIGGPIGGEHRQRDEKAREPSRGGTTIPS